MATIDEDALKAFEGLVNLSERYEREMHCERDSISSFDEAYTLLCSVQFEFEKLVGWIHRVEKNGLDAGLVEECNLPNKTIYCEAEKFIQNTKHPKANKFVRSVRLLHQTLILVASK